MNIIVGPTAPYKGGIAQHTTELAHRLLAAGTDTQIESWRRQYPRSLYPGKTQFSDCEHREFPYVARKLSWNNPLSWVFLARRLRRSLDMVIFVGVTPVQYPVYAAALLCAGRSVRRRSVLIAHNVVPHEPGWFDVTLSKIMFKMVGAVLTHSPIEREKARLLGAHAGDSLLPFHFDHSEANPEVAREPGLLAFVGFVRPYKGLEILLEAIASSEGNFKLEVLGEFWSDVNHYRDLAHLLGVSDRCHFRDYYASTVEILQLLDRAEALVMPYKEATSSQLPRIAFTRGTPVIATNVGDLPHQVRHGIDGLVCEPTSAAISAALTSLTVAGRLRELRDGVDEPDVDAEWSQYLDELNRLCCQRDEHWSSGG